jgi:hypothetical protein
MLTGVIVTLLALLAVAFFALTGRGRDAATGLQITLTWLWLTRISLLALVTFFAFPLLAQGLARTLLIGAYDLQGGRSGLIGAGCIGVLLSFGIWTVFVTAALTLSYGQRRTLVCDPPPEGVGVPLRIVLFAALLVNFWTALAATDPADRPGVGFSIGTGVLLGLAAIWCIEEIHRQINFFSMQRYHLLPHRSARPRRRQQPNDTAFFNNLPLDKKTRERLRGYVGWKDQRTYLLPGHGLALLATVVFGLLIYLPLNFFINPASRLTALAYLLVSFIFWIWVLAGTAFFFDAYRIPILLPLLAWLLVTPFFPKADHFYRIWPARLANTGPSPMTPSEVLTRAHVEGRKVVLVAAAGGGIQSAAWTAKVLAGLEREAGRREPGGFVRSLQALSGVSGGSTGIMFFTAGYGSHGFAGPGEAPRPYNPALLDQIPAAAYATSLGQTTWGLAYPDLGRAFFPFYVRDPFRDRAEAMELAWVFNAESAMGETGKALRHASLRDWQNDTRAGRRPAVIFNSTIVETGERMRFSSAPSQPDEGRCEFGAAPATSVNKKSAKLYLYPGADIRITTAVRLSATFPFVSPSARAGPTSGPNEKRLLDAKKITPDATGNLHLADGGYYENSGLSDLAQWLDQGLTATRPSDRPDDVLVIQIDAFPENQADGEKMKAKHPQFRFTSGSLFQFFAPVITLASVRGAGHAAFANYDFRLLRYRWQNDPNHRVTIRHVRFVLPALTAEQKREAKGGSWWPKWAEANPTRPPLSWHLRGPEQRAIDDAWKQLLGESKGAFEANDGEWEDTTTRPIDKVLSFLEAQSTSAPSP